MACDRGDWGRGGITFVLSGEGSIMSMLLSEDCLNSMPASPLTECVTVESDWSFVPQSLLYFTVVVEKIQRERVRNGNGRALITGSGT